MDACFLCNPYAFDLFMENFKNQDLTDYIKYYPPQNKILSQVLIDYDRETTDFYRWKVEYSQKELSELIKLKSEIDFGEIIDLIPIERGYSGRLIKLKIIIFR